MPHDTQDTHTPDSIRWGRRSHTFVPMPEWILLGGLTPQAVTLYSLLLAHVNRKEGDGLAWPGLRTLAGMMGFRRHQSVHRYVQELEEVGAISVQRTKDGPTGNRNVYRINETPEESYTGVRSLGDFYALRRDQNRGLVRSTAQGLFPAGDKGLSAVEDQNQTNATRRTDQDESTSSDAACGPLAAGEARPRTSSQTPDIPKIRLDLPDNFDDLKAGAAMSQLIRSAYGALRRVGLEPAPDARNRLRNSLRHHLDVDEDRHHVAWLLCETLKLAGTSSETWGDLAYPVRTEERRAS